MCFLLKAPEEIQKAKAAKPEPTEVKPVIIKAEMEGQRPDPAAKTQPDLSKPKEVQKPGREPVSKPKPAIKAPEPDISKPEPSKPEPTPKVAPKEISKTGIQALLFIHGSNIS